MPCILNPSGERYVSFKILGQGEATLTVWYRHFVKTPHDEFRSMVQSFMDENRSWIIDGDYEPVAHLVRPAATSILCTMILLISLTQSTQSTPQGLDPPFVLLFPRLILRTFLQTIGVVPPCSPGCNDNLVDLIFWEGKSVVLWCWTHHTPFQKAHSSAMQVAGDDQGGKWIRISGWVGSVNAWLKDVESFAKAR